MIDWDYIWNSVNWKYCMGTTIHTVQEESAFVRIYK